jgi:outer membrane receptor protein involved in Fe transport
MSVTQVSNSGLAAPPRLRQRALTTVGLFALLLAAQAAAAQDIAQVGVAEEVTVTGTRVIRDGYNAPTPVTVIGSDQIQAQAPANLADFVNQLPSIIGSTTSNNSSGSLSNGLAGINALNLRALGVNRTLILLDGHRTPASAATGETDINTIPQQLVKRVDVVTGGASADYGSDAVGGIVNFILDKEFVGLKGEAQYGQTDDGLQPSYKVNLTYGLAFDEGKGHVVVSGEYVSTAGIHNYDPPWNKSGFFRVLNPAWNATTNPTAPYYLIQTGIGASQVAPGGLILSSTTTAGASSTALRGTYFGTNASVNNLAFGTTTGPWMIGGDTAVTQANYEGTNSLAAGEIRGSVYAKASYYILPEMELYADLSISRYKGLSYYQQPPSVGGITIQADNAFLPASIKTQMTSLGLRSFTEGSTNSGFPLSGSRNGREAQRIAAGLDGSFDLFTTWNYDLHAQIGVANVREQEVQTWNNAKLAFAQDSVVVTAANAGNSGAAIGSIQCRAVLQGNAAAAGCQPLSRIGLNGGLQDTLMGAGSFQKGLDYVLGQPYRLQRLSEQDISINITGNPFDLWAGPVSLAFGGEWRLEAINGSVPSQFQSGWLFGNYLVNHGHYSVAETYLETVVPIIEGMDFNGAVRYTAYSTSGGVTTWKGGLTYQPIEDIKLRTTYSHDIRAPNLADLFAAGIARTNTVNINNVAYTFVQNQTGNPNLSPESANSLGAGVVLTPSVIPGLAASVDYYNITISKAIGSISAQNTADQCYIQKIQSYCDNISYIGGGHAVVGIPPATQTSLDKILLVPFNFTKQKAEGIDFDVTYQVPLDQLAMFGAIPGDLTLNVLMTNYIRNYTESGVNPSTDTAGVNAGNGLPSWNYRVSATYHAGGWTFFVMGRGFSEGVYSNEYITCTTGCPAYTLAHPTSNYNHIDGAFYVDVSTTYKFNAFGTDSQVFLSIKNLLDTDPAPVASGPDGNNIPAYPQTNRNLFDYLGRVYHFGVRFRT